MKIGIGLLIAIVGFASSMIPYPAAGQTSVVSVPPSEFTETLHRSRKIRNSGPLVGVQSTAARLDVGNPIITVSGIKPSDKLVCLTISHASGVYVGKAKIKNSSFAGTVSFQLPAKLLKDVSRSAKQYAILAQASAENYCHSRNDILFATWGNSPPRGKVVIALSASPTAATRVVVQGAVGGSRCQTASNYLAPKRLTFQSFSRVCSVSLSGECRQEARLEIIINESGRRVAIPRKVFRRSC